MPRWLPRVLRRIHQLAAQGRVRFTAKALSELGELGSGLDAEDAVEVLAGLRAADAVTRLISEHTGEWMYVFRPYMLGEVVYTKLVLRTDCIVVSFHREVDDEGHEGVEGF
jgi:hypothetical protein